MSSLLGKDITMDLQRNTQMKRKKIKIKKKRKKMSDDINIYKLQSWMYTHKDYAGRVTNAFLNGLETFMYQVGCTPIAHESGKMLCPCRKGKNAKFACSETV